MQDEVQKGSCSATSLMVVQALSRMSAQRGKTLAFHPESFCPRVVPLDDPRLCSVLQRLGLSRIG